MLHHLRGPQPGGVAAGLPALMFDDRRISVHGVDAESGHGRVSLKVQDPLRWAQRTDAVLQRSSTAFALNTLGL